MNSNEEGGLDKFTKSYAEFGMHVQPNGAVHCKEWCPGAKHVYLWGDFSKIFCWINLCFVYNATKEFIILSGIKFSLYFFWRSLDNSVYISS